MWIGGAEKVQEIRSSGLIDVLDVEREKEGNLGSSEPLSGEWSHLLGRNTF